MSKQDVYSEEWHKGFQMGLYSGIATERERIIKLLKDAFISDGESLASAKLNELIALIKGENK